jgi:hypothetical protein
MKCEARRSKCETAVTAAGGRPSPRRIRKVLFQFQCFLGALLCLLAGCASHSFVGERPFDFEKDSFAYANELVWDYYYDGNGNWVHKRHEPEPDYTHHCFVVARSARQFFQQARFDPSAPVADEAAYRRLIRQVVDLDPDRVLPESKKIVIPGYADLRTFSTAQEKLLKAECGGAWQSYLQRGHWRVVFPFSRSGQEKAAKQLIQSIRQNRPPVIHVIRFPSLAINHALLLFEVKEAEDRIEFAVYDPNKPDSPKVLTFDRATRTFSYPANDYFSGGPVDVYEIYRNWKY